MKQNDCILTIHAYQAANLTDEEVISSFVVRKKIYQRVFSEIRRDDMTGSIQHYLLIGRRGSGKSTLLRRIQAEVNQQEDLNNRLLAVYLSEEQAGVYRLHDLWDLVLQALHARGISTGAPAWTDFRDDTSGYSLALYQCLQNTLKMHKKKLLLLLDNIDRIFDNIQDEASLLRELLINHKDLRIVGGSTRMSEHYWKFDLPFYEFFRIIRLDSLKKDEVTELMMHWSTCKNLPELGQFIQQQPGKIETIRVLTDGMPRTLLRFIEIIIDRPRQNGFEYLRFILDRASALFQQRLNNLPPSQRKIVLELANLWDAAKVKTLTDACKMPGKVISALLNQLVQHEIVEKVRTGKKDHLYRLSDRFFNLWLLMTQGGPGEKQQVKYLTVFLENWYGREEVEEDYSSSSENLEDHARYIGALLWNGKMKESQQLIDKKIPEGVKNQDIDFLLPLFVELLIHHQYNLAWQWFQDEQYGRWLKELIKPMYYVAASFMGGKEQEEELLKPGAELTDGIEKITAFILERQRLHYGSTS